MPTLNVKGAGCIFLLSWGRDTLNNVRSLQMAKATSNNTNNIFFTVEYSYSGN